MGLCSSQWCFIFPRCRWGEWNHVPFTIGHVPILLQWAYFYGCHVWHQQFEVPFIHTDGVRFSLHRGASFLSYHKSANMWRLGGMVECHACKASFAYATLTTIMFHCGWCPIGTLSIAIGCRFLFYFLLDFLMFWYYVIVNGKHIDVGCTRLCGVETLSQFFFVRGMCWKHGSCTAWKKSRI
jgi:hypothetical protein